MPAVRQDIELRTMAHQPLAGYPSLSELIASDQELGTTLVFKRFNKLAARNLLYLQSELAYLGAEQAKYDGEDADVVRSDLSQKQCSRNWEEFAKQAKTDDKQKQRMTLAMNIRKKLHEYRKLRARNCGAI